MRTFFISIITLICLSNVCTAQLKAGIDFGYRFLDLGDNFAVEGVRDDLLKYGAGLMYDFDNLTVGLGISVSSTEWRKDRSRYELSAEDIYLILRTEIVEMEPGSTLFLECNPGVGFARLYNKITPESQADLETFYKTDGFYSLINICTGIIIDIKSTQLEMVIGYAFSKPGYLTGPGTVNGNLLPEETFLTNKEGNPMSLDISGLFLSFRLNFISLLPQEEKH